MDKSAKAPRRLLIAARKERLWSQQDLASLLGTTQHNISRWEQSTTTPSPYFSKKLCELFGKSAQELGLFSEVAEREEQMPTGERVAESPQTPPVPAVQPLSLWMVPHPRNPHFTGRDAFLSQLEQQFSDTESKEQATLFRAALTQPQAIKGLGGIGKTQIAVEYAYRAREQGRYAHILWINTASAETVMASFVALADLLPDFAEKNETNQLKLVAAIKRWLEQCQQRWLLIFDNADEVSLVQEYVPTEGKGNILLTTRASAVGSFATPIAVEAMSFVEGTQLLLRRAQRLENASDEEINEAGNIVVALDHFPLALDQAGAYIEETGCSFATYLQLLQDHRQDLLARRGTQATHYPDSVATTWSLSFQKVEQHNPAATELLRVCAFLAPDHIPEELLREGAPQWPPVLQQAASDLFAFNQMLEDLLAFSLVKRLADQQLLSIHRLVQIIQVDAMTQEEQQQWAERAVRAVHTVFPGDPKAEIASWPQCLRYLEQAQACNVLIQQYQILLPEAAELLDRTGVYLREHASYTLAEPLFQRAIHIWEQQVQQKHPQVAFPLHNLAMLYDKRGQYEEAEQLFQRAISLREQQLGPEHLLVATSLNGLANIFYTQGKHQKAEPLYQRALCIREQQLGSEHPQVASLLGNLANIYSAQGRYQEAEPLYQQVIELQERQLGPEHLAVAHSLNALANLYFEQGKYREAEPLFQRTRCIWEQQLGLEHPLVAIVLNNLANNYVGLAKYTEAEPLYQRALRNWEQQLGPEHFYLTYALNGLADLYRIQKRYTEAEALYQRTLAIREHTLDPHHSGIADTLYGFAALQEALGNLQQAATYSQRALEIREQVFGAEHPKTIEARTQYLRLLAATGLEEELLKKR